MPRFARMDAPGTWYHSLELAPGEVTPGWFDLRPIAAGLPWPEVDGRRCLDVGPWDGFYAFELERRGATSVTAAEIPDHADWDWPFSERRLGPEAMRSLAGEAPGAGFEHAVRVLRSSVERIEASIYDLDPDRHGSFDVVTCGSLLLHLRDPVRALEALATVVPGGLLLSVETISLPESLLSPRRPAAALNGIENCQWWTPNVAAHRRMLGSAGFTVLRSTRPFAIPFGEGHPRHRAKLSLRDRLDALGRRIVCGRDGLPHAAVLARAPGG